MFVSFKSKYGNYKFICRLDEVNAIEYKNYVTYFHMKNGKVIETGLNDDEVFKVIDEIQFPDKFKAEVNK